MQIMCKSSTNVSFFQEEEGIRDVAVTGVQTCALPIWRPRGHDRTAHLYRVGTADRAHGGDHRRRGPCAGGGDRRARVLGRGPHRAACARAPADCRGRRRLGEATHRIAVPAGVRGERRAVTSRHARLPQSILWPLALLTLFWGFNWPVVKTVLTVMSPLHFRSWGLAVGAASLFAMARLRGLPIRVPRGTWGRLSLISMFNVGAWHVLTAYGIPLMASGRAAILAYTFPVFAVLFSVWLLKERLPLRRAAGLVLGIAGLALLLGSELAAVGRSQLGALLLLGSAVSWALGTVVMKRLPVDL